MKTEEKATLHNQSLLMDQLEALKTRILGIHADIPCLKERLELSNLLQKLYEIRERLNQLEKALLQTHISNVPSRRASRCRVR